MLIAKRLVSIARDALEQAFWDSYFCIFIFLYFYISKTEIQMCEWQRYLSTL